jgi:PAS domain S-box-containing protein
LTARIGRDEDTHWPAEARVVADPSANPAARSLSSVEATDAVVRIDGEGRVIAWDAAAERIFERRREDVLGREMADLIIPPHLRERHRRGLARFHATGEGPVVGRRVQITGMRADGTLVPVELAVAATPTPSGGHTFTASVRALEERRVEDRRRSVLPVLAHELRTPLTAIHGCLGALAESELSSRDRRLVELASKAAERMERLIGDLLDLESAETSAAALSLETVEIAGLLRESVDAVRAQAAATGVSVDLLEPPVDLVVHGDRARLLQVVNNLLSNAIRFSPCGESVRLACERRGSMVRVKVSDRGPGISEAFRDRLFQRFARGVGGPSGYKGSGLGLAISRLIVEAHAGRIGFEPALEGGAIFSFELPAAAAAGDGAGGGT